MPDLHPLVHKLEGNIQADAQYDFEHQLLRSVNGA